MEHEKHKRYKIWQIIRIHRKSNLCTETKVLRYVPCEWPFWCQLVPCDLWPKYLVTDRLVARYSHAEVRLSVWERLVLGQCHQNRHHPTINRQVGHRHLNTKWKTTRLAPSVHSTFQHINTELFKNWKSKYACSVTLPSNVEAFLNVFTLGRSSKTRNYISTKKKKLITKAQAYTTKAQSWLMYKWEINLSVSEARLLHLLRLMMWHWQRAVSWLSLRMMSQMTF